MPRSVSRFVILLAILFAGYVSSAQNSLTDDIRIIVKTRIDSSQYIKVAHPFLYSRETKPLVKYNPVNLAFGGLLFLYQNLLSQQFSASCLYDPSCSEFSKQAISEYGLPKGIFLSADRLMRCNRIAATGIHPIRVENNKVSDPVNFYRIGK